MHKIRGANLQCMKNHYTKFEYKGKKLLELQITQGRHPKSVAHRRTDGEEPLLDLPFAKATQPQVITKALIGLHRCTGLVYTLIVYMQ